MDRLGHASPLVWSPIVLQIAFPGQDQVGDALTEDQGEHALQTLFALLDEFMAEREHGA